MIQFGVTYGLLLYFITSTQERDGSLKLGEVLSSAHLVNFFFRLLQKAVGGIIKVSNKALSLFRGIFVRDLELRFCPGLRLPLSLVVLKRVRSSFDLHSETLIRDEP